MSWRSDTYFQRVFGFEEDGYDKSRDELFARAKFSLPPATSAASRISTLPAVAERCELTFDSTIGPVDAGTFYEPSSAELAEQLQRNLANEATSSKVRAYAEQFRASHKGKTVVLKNTVGESRSMHGMSKYAGCVFQAASQFNYLEFPSPGTTPEHGIGSYEYDRTQGPACAIACAVGTAVRNYLIPPLKSAADPDRRTFSAQERGQRKDCQRNGLADVEAKFVALMRENPAELPTGASGDLSRAPTTQNVVPRAALPWKVRSGYIDALRDPLSEANKFLRNPEVRDQLRPLLRVGVHEGTAVVDHAKVAHPVTQVYCSAVSVGYSKTPPSVWEPLATLVLEGLYEATFLAAMYNTVAAIEAGAKPPKLLLTKVGGGVFGNKSLWIKNAIQRAAASAARFGVPLEVELVHYGEVEVGYEDDVVARWSQ